MNIKIPVAVAIERVQKRIKEIKEVTKKNAEIKKKNEENRKKHHEYLIGLLLSGKYEITMGGNYNGKYDFHAQLGNVKPRPENIPYVPTVPGNIADLERTLELLKITTSAEVNLKSVKGLAEMV